MQISRGQKLLVLALVAVLLMALYGVVRNLGGTESEEGSETGEQAETIEVFDFSAADVQAVTYAYTDAGESGMQSFMLERTAEGWAFVDSASPAPDQAATEAALEAVAGLKASRQFTLEGTADLAEYGLDAPSSRIRLTVGEGDAAKTYTLLTGSYNDVAAANYAMLQGGKEIYLVDTSYEESFQSLQGSTAAA